MLRDRQPLKFVKVLFHAFSLSPFNLNFMFPTLTVPISKVIAIRLPGSTKGADFAKVTTPILST